ncbi:MAG: transcription-repair coupling factor [Bryobacterales bacterium]|nr:transcription-repair coupling factor [Bryobacterales bacterium]
MTHPAIRDLFLSLARTPSLQDAIRRLQTEESPALGLTGLTDTAKAVCIVLLWQGTERPLLVITESPRQAEEIWEPVQTFFNLLASDRQAGRPQLLPALDVLPFQGLSPHTEISEERAVGLWRLATERVPVTITPVAGALLRTEDAGFYRQLALSLAAGDEVPFEEVVDHLYAIGYQKRDPVEMVGEFSVRGGILDVFSPRSPRPVRIEFLGDLIESVRLFDVESQRSVLKVAHCTLLPLVEHPASPGLLQRLREIAGRERAAGEEESFPGWEFLTPLVRQREGSLVDLMERPVVVWVEPEGARRAADRLWERLEEGSASHPCPPERAFWRWEEWRRRLASQAQVSLSEITLGVPETAGQVRTRPAMAFHGNLPVAVAEVRNLVESGGRAVFFAPTTGEVERLADVFSEYAVPFHLSTESAAGVSGFHAERAYLAGPSAGTILLKGQVRRGTVFLDPMVAIYGSEDLFDASELVAKAGAARAASAFAADLADLKAGDYVVHAQHGVGRFLGLREIAQDGDAADYMLLEYAGESKLYVPLSRMDLVQRFRGAGEAAPPLDKLGGVTWERTKTRVKARMRDMAGELLKLYAERRLAEGFAFSRDSNWQREFEDAFEFVETPDQLTAIRDVKRDMESPQPMDRLLCGDVGFGKTEVAMRAAFKALGDGRQVAVLAPTTVLTFQHFETFRRRFAPFPVRVEMLSRFVTPEERGKILADIAAGKVDIVAGTHRLLSKDVEFRDLGLLVVDEEQRFGVRHKERLKQLKKNVDVLTLTATPIPRTLHMSLLGLRDLSVLETPPKDRLAIHTVVAPFDPGLIRQAIELETGRGGQVYFVHNRVETIWERAAELQQLAPECRIAVGHGQMAETQLEKAMIGFMRHDYDLLLATTIIENGLDIPLANTLIVDNAQNYGLSELYQLRGRVGRSNRRAYAYFLVPGEKELTGLARKRLAALREFSELGAGFKIAALDLELRGAGNLLGGEQHGHINAVGFDMYLKLLEESVRELKGEQVPLEVRTSLSLGLDLRIPAGYIAEEQQRLRAYKRISEARDQEQAAAVLADLSDRYGPPPAQVAGLVQFAVLKSRAEALGIESIDRRGGFLNLKLHPESGMAPDRLMDYVRRTPGCQFSPAGVLRLPAGNAGEPAELLDTLRECFASLGAG